MGNNSQKFIVPCIDFGASKRDVRTSLITNSRALASNEHILSPKTTHQVLSSFSGNANTVDRSDSMVELLALSVDLFVAAFDGTASLREEAARCGD